MHRNYFDLRFDIIMEHELKDITAVVNHKGGVAKTSTVLSLAGGLLRENKNARVLVIDIDPQCNLSTLCGWNTDKTNKQTNIYNTLSEEGEGSGIPVYKTDRGIYFSPASKWLKIDLDLRNQDIPQGVLWNRFGSPIDDHTGDGLTTIEDSFDYIFIDCPPALSDVTCNAIVVASRVLIPVQLEPFSINGLADILLKQAELDRKLRKMLQGQNYEEQETVIVPVITGSKTKISRGYYQYLQDSFGDYLSKCCIRKDVKIQESQALFKDIFEYAPYSRVAIDYEMLIKELYN